MEILDNNQVHIEVTLILNIKVKEDTTVRFRPKLTCLSTMPAGTVKIFKKCSPNGRVYLYLGNREFVACDGSIKPITGVVNIQVSADVGEVFLHHFMSRTTMTP